MPAFKLSDVKDPVFEIELPDGTVKKCDPWAALEKIGKPADDGSQFDAIRTALGFPTEAEVAEAVAGPTDGTPKPFTPSRHACMELFAALNDFVQGLAVSKKLSSLSPR